MPQRALFENEINRVLQGLQRYGVDDVRIGLEWEVAPFDEIEEIKRNKNRRLSNPDAILKRRKIYIERALDQAPLQHRQEFMHFTPEEYFMHALHERECGALFEYRFGCATGGFGYWDNRGILEIRLKHCSIKDFFFNYDAALEAIYKNSQELGIIFGPATAHTNISFWSKGKNINDLTCVKSHQARKFILQGLSYALSFNECEDEDDTIEVGPSRRDAIRILPNRNEIRITHAVSNRFSVSPEFSILTLCAGVLLSFQRTIDPILLQQTEKVIFNYAGQSHRYFSDEILEAYVNNDNCLAPRPASIFHYVNHIANELKITAGADYEAYLFQAIFSFMNDIKINPLKRTIEFPSDEFDPDFYTLRLPMQNYRHLPQHLQNALRQANTDEKYKALIPLLENFISPEDKIPLPEKKIKIDLRPLKKIFNRMDVVKIWAHDPREDYPVRHASFVEKAQALNLSPEFLEAAKEKRQKQEPFLPSP